jgi:hypothetical protein
MQARFLFAAVFLAAFVLAADGSHAQYRTFFAPSLSVSEEFTDNLFLTEENEESEFITVVSPRVSFILEGKRSNAELSYSPGFTFYQDNDELNSVRHSVSLSGSRQLTKRLSLSAADNFRRTEEPYTRGELTLDPEAEKLEDVIDYTIRTEREPRYTNDAQIRMDYDFGRESSVYAQYSHRLYRDETPGAEDSDKHNPGVGFTYWPDAWNGFRGSASYTRGLFEEGTEDFHNWEGSFRYIRNLNRFWGGFFEYKHVYTNFEGEEEDYHVYNPAVGTSYTFSEDASVELSVGYFLQDREDGDSETGASVDLDMRKAWRFKRGAFRISGGSGFEQTYFRSENLGFTQYYGVRSSLEYAFTRYLQGSLSANYRFNRYLDEDPVREDHVASASGGLTYTLTRWLDISLRETFRVVETNQEGSGTNNDYKENSVVLRVTVAPSPMVITK